MAQEKEPVARASDAHTARADSPDPGLEILEEKDGLDGKAQARGATSDPLQASSSPGSSPRPSAGGDANAAIAEGSAPSAVEDQLPPRYSIYSRWEKSLIVLGASMAAFISPLTGQIYLPAINVISEDLHITSSQVNLTITTYMIFQGITPMFLGGLADGVGRRPAYIICFVIYILANIGLALSRNYASLLVIRCIQSAGSASTVALCQAVVADIVSSAERGQYMGITVIPIIFAPSLGPVLGGVLSQYMGWRSIFWFQAIMGGVIFILLLLFLPETCRKIVGDGSIRPHPFHQTLYQLIQARYRRRKAREDPSSLHRTTSAASSTRTPLKIQVPNLLGSIQLAVQKPIGLLLVFSSLIFCGFYAIATAMPVQLRDSYGMDDLHIGLMYLPTAGGSILAAFIMGPGINWNYRRHAAKLGIPVDKSRQQDLSNFPIERARLEIGIPLYLLTSAVVLVWGFALERRAHLAVLCVLLFLNGVGMIGYSNAASALLVDITPGRPGAAVAANNLTRCLIGAAGIAVIMPMINAMGDGWTFFLLGAIFFASTPGMFVLMNKGIAWRKELHEKEERKRKTEEREAAGAERK